MTNHNPKNYSLMQLLRNELINELAKSIAVYDGSNNKIYEKKTFPESAAGDVALSRGFQYDGSNNLLYSVASVSTWLEDDELNVRPVITDISLSISSVTDGDVAGTKVADISSTGGIAPFYYELVDNEDNMFRIDNDDELTLDDIADIADTPYNIGIKVIDSNGLTYTKTFSITVLSFVNTLSTEFDGVSENISIANPSNFHFESGGVDQPFSLSAWCKMVDATSSYIICKGSTTNREYFFGFSTTDRIQLIIYGNTNYIQAYSTDALTADESSWHFYTCTYNGNGLNSGIKLYRDGVELLTSRVGTGYDYMKANIAGFNIGSYSGGGGYYDGKIDQVSIWNKALSLIEVGELYNSGVPFDISVHSAYANCVSWWRMGDGDTYPTILDRKNSNNGTMINMTVANFVADVP